MYEKRCPILIYLLAAPNNALRHSELLMFCDFIALLTLLLNPSKSLLCCAINIVIISEMMARKFVSLTQQLCNQFYVFNYRYKNSHIWPYSSLQFLTISFMYYTLEKIRSRCDYIFNDN